PPQSLQNYEFSEASSYLETTPTFNEVYVHSLFQGMDG
ncbi:hypothetical protein A2U01_0076698, partial [Trifolium medium]|nr:hypothetical protein [Trifolium medium]